LAYSASASVGSRRSLYLVALQTILPGDDEGERLFALYKVSSAKEIAATYQLLHPSRSLPHETYMKLLGNLTAIRTECNVDRLAVEAHHEKMLELAAAH
jgi:hypothetical protein